MGDYNHVLRTDSTGEAQTPIPLVEGFEAMLPDEARGRRSTTVDAANARVMACNGL